MATLILAKPHSPAILPVLIGQLHQDTMRGRRGHLEHAERGQQGDGRRPLAQDLGFGAVPDDGGGLPG
jgi:hypothetical protein